MPKKVLIIASHPDDEVLGCGGAIAKHTDQGDKVTILMLTDCLRPGRPDSERLELREVTKKVAEILGGADVLFAEVGVHERKRFDELPFKNLIFPIERAIDGLKPDIIYTHHRGDLNTDHQIAFKATIAAARTMRKHLVKRVLCYEVPSSTEQAPPFPEYLFTPNAFVDIHEYIDRKIEALSLYTLELHDYPHPRSLDNVRNVAKVRGSQCNLHYVEAFCLIRDII